MRSASQEELNTLRESELFDEKYYLDQYPDVKLLNMDPAEHYLWLGAKLRRDPSMKFSTAKYLEFHTDVKSANVNPLLHYIKSGRREGRRIAPVEVHVGERLTCDRIVNRRIESWDYEAEKALLARLNEQSRPVSDIFVSVIMPTFNRAGCISAAIQSVLDQTHDNWELIVVDDGSTDNTRALVEGFNNTRITYVKNPESEGVSKARNLGLGKSSGEWVFFLDSDNTWNPLYLETMLKFTAYHDLRAAYCGAELKGDGNKTKGYLFAEFEFESCLKHNFIDLNTFCVKAELAQIKFDETLRRLVDWDYILRIAARTPMRAAQFVGVAYYDGDQHNRITRSEYRKNSELDAIMTKIRQNAKRNIQSYAGTSRGTSRMAVVLHVYHVQYVDECLKYLDNIGEKFDLFITSHYNDGDDVIRKIKRSFPDAIAIQYPNVGFDIGAFLSLASTLCNYELVCKIHAKRNVSPWGGTWRATMLDALLGSRSLVDGILSEFRADEHLCAVGPKEFFKDVEVRSSPETYYRLLDLADACGFRKVLEKPCGFFAGTAFWVRPHLLYPIARYTCDRVSYSSAYQHDDLVEHALERAFGVALQADPKARVGLTDMRPGEQFTFKKAIGSSAASKEAITNTLKRIHKTRGLPALRYFPDYTSNNAYQRLLYGQFDSYDVGPGNIGECIELQRKTGQVVFHLHWINPVLGPAKSEHEADRIADDYIAQLRQFASLGGRIIWTVHNIISHEPKFLEQELKLSRALTELAEWIHVHHASVAEATEPYYHLPADKIVVAEHGNYIGTLPEDTTRSQARAELGLPAAAKVFLFLGQIRGYKGIDELIAAFRELSSKHADCWLVIAGKLLGISQSEVERKLAGLGNVVFQPGYVPDERMQVYLKSADAMVLPYRKVLTSGSVFLAMSFGMPVICPRVGLLAHMVGDGMNGVVYDAEDPRGLHNAMERFAVAPSSDLERMRAGALETAQSHRWEETSAKLRRHIEGADFGQIVRTEIEGSRRVWFVKGDLEAFGKKQCLAIVLHYQNRDDTRECINRLSKQGPEVGVILISNAETVDDIRVLAAEFPHIVAVQSEDNIGYAAANNFGLWVCLSSQAEFFWLVNPDIVVPDGYYSEMVRRTEKWPDHDFFGSTIVVAQQPDKAIFCGGEVRLDQGARPGHLHMGSARSLLPKEPFECDYLTGANVFGRTSALAEAGFLPEHYFLYFEETEWFLAMRSKGRFRKPLVFPDLVVENHKRSEAGLVPGRYYIYYFIRNSLNFGKKFAGGQMDVCVREARKFADAWLAKVARGAPERLGEFQKLVERAFEDGNNARTGRVSL